MVVLSIDKLDEFIEGQSKIEGMLRKGAEVCWGCNFRAFGAGRTDAKSLLVVLVHVFSDEQISSDFED